MELGEREKAFADRGYGLAAVTYDSQAILKHFAERAQIRYPLLADVDSAVIRAFGILNESIPKDGPFYGVPHPGTYVVDRTGAVRSKHFERDYRERFTGGGILVREFVAPGLGKVQEASTRHLKLRTWTSNEIVYPGSRLTLVLEVALGRKLHVYAPGVHSEYIAVDWQVPEGPGWTTFPAEYPPSRTLYLKAIREKVPVFERTFRVLRDIKVRQGKELAAAALEGRIRVSGSFRYQACDDRVCYPPESVPLQWELDLRPQDRTRVPAGIRKAR